MTAILPIRWRITLWYAALLLTTLAIFGAGLYLGLRTLLFDNFAEQVSQQAALLAAGLDRAADRPIIDADTLDDFDDEERFLRVYAADGSVIADTSAAAEISADALGSVDPRAAEARYQIIASDLGNFGVATVPIKVNDTVIGVLQIGLNREDVDEMLRAVVLVFAIGAPFVLGAAVAGGYVVSRRMLRPVVTITDLATALQADALGSRLNLTLPNDELGRLAGAFDAMLARIDAAFARQRQFTGDAAHELRTPLSLMRSQVDLALSRERSLAEYREALQSLGGDIERLTQLVTTLLTLARADAGKLRIEREPVDLATIVASLIDAYQQRADELGITLVDESDSTPVLADADLLVQLLVNLTDNALAHTPPGGRVAIGCEPRSRQACLWVVDSGDGIAPEHHARIFERFYRVDAGRARDQGGAGLGLAFCQAIADAHGGSLTVDSEPGRGSRFECCLPTA